MSTELTPTPELLDFAPRHPPPAPVLTRAQGWRQLQPAPYLGMPSIDPEVNSRKTAKQNLVRWMDRRIRDDCDADTAKTKAKLICELLHTYLYDHQTYFDKRKVGDRRRVDMTSPVFASMRMRATLMPKKRSSSCSPS